MIDHYNVFYRIEALVLLNSEGLFEIKQKRRIVILNVQNKCRIEKKQKNDTITIPVNQMVKYSSIN